MRLLSLMTINLRLSYSMSISDKLLWCLSLQTMTTITANEYNLLTIIRMLSECFRTWRSYMYVVRGLGKLLSGANPSHEKNQLSIMRIFACNSAASASSLYQKTFYMMYEDTIEQGLRSAWSDSYGGRGQPTTLSHAPHAFRFVPCFGGITGDFGSLESFAHPGHYLRHSGYVIYLKRMANRYAPYIKGQKNLKPLTIKSHI